MEISSVVLTSSFVLQYMICYLANCDCFCGGDERFSQPNSSAGRSVIDSEAPVAQTFQLEGLIMIFLNPIRFSFFPWSLFVLLTGSRVKLPVASGDEFWRGAERFSRGVWDQELVSDLHML
jgi:hypothetical protein